MCTMIVEQAPVEAVGRAQGGWIALSRADVAYDHPFRLPLEHALTIDFVDPAAGLDARVAVELTPASARRLAEAILAALDRGEAYERGG